MHDYYLCLCLFFPPSIGAAAPTSSALPANVQAPLFTVLNLFWQRPEFIQTTSLVRVIDDFPFSFIRRMNVFTICFRTYIIETFAGGNVELRIVEIGMPKPARSIIALVHFWFPAREKQSWADTTHSSERRLPATARNVRLGGTNTMFSTYGSNAMELHR